MVKKSFFSILFLFLGFSCFSQYGKQLTELLGNVKDASYYDSTRLFSVGEKTIVNAKQSQQFGAIAEVHIYYGNYFFYMRNLKKAESYFKQSLEEATKTNAEQVEVLAQIRLAFLSYEKGNNAEAEKELNNLLAQSKKNKDYKNTAELLNLLGIIREESNDENGAAKLYLEGVSLSETNHLNYYSAVFKNNLGLIKLYVGQTKGAIKDFEEGLLIAQKENNKRLTNHLQMNICLANVSDNKPEKAIRLFNDVIKYARINNLPTELASDYINLGSAFTNIDQGDVALTYYDSAIVVLKQHDMKFELTKAYLGKINVLVQLKKIAVANNLLIKTKELAKETGNLEDLSSCHFMQYKILSNEKKYKEALDEHILYIQIKDSLGGAMNTKIIEELQQNYIAQKKEVELEKEKSKSILLEKSNQEERYLKWFSIATAGILLVLIVTIVFLRYNKKIKIKQEQFSRQLIQNIEEERQRISRDLHDDIGQSLSVIKSKIIKEKQNTKEPSEQLENELGRVIEQTREISRNLYPTHLEKIGLTRSIATIMESVQSATKLECSFEIAEKTDLLPLSVQTHIFRIIQECINNTIKHSGATGLKLMIQEKNDDYVLNYQDNGAGFKIKKYHIGIGLQSIQERAKIIYGTIDIDGGNENGFKLILKFSNTKA
jgi:two-component system NarL family sensor kinase